MTGFAADPGSGAPVRKVEILLDKEVPGETRLSGLRPDVAAHFSRKDYRWSGWSGTVSLEGAPPGKHRIFVAVVGKSGLKTICGAPEIQVLAVSGSPRAPVAPVAAGILLRAAALLFWLGLVGWAPARLLASGSVALSAPLFGLCLFAAAAEAGRLTGLRPFGSAVALTALSATALLASFQSRAARPRRPRGPEAGALVGAGLVLAIGVVPLASHGEGAVLGNIDDAVRECSLADSINRYAFRPPELSRGYFSDVPLNMGRDHVRPGGGYLLSALAKAFGVRAHAVYSAAMLGTMTLIVLASGLLASRLLRSFRAGRWLLPALVAGNSTLLATLYGQHLGNLLSVALFLFFLSGVLFLIRSPRAGSVWPAALAAAGALTLYPETTPVWGVAALLALGAAGAARRPRTLRRLAAAALLAAAVNPAGFVRAARFLVWTNTQSREMASSELRLLAGDTHYFPRPTVALGLEAYREDAPAPLGAVRAILVPIAGILMAAAALAGWVRGNAHVRWIAAMLVLPAASALAWTWRLTFPYAFAKFLPLAAPVWIAAFLLLAGAALERASHILRFASVAALVLAAALALPPARHVFFRAWRAVPPYDPDFEELPKLAATAAPKALFLIDEPIAARREWMRYFLGEYETLPLGAPVPGWIGPDHPRYLVLDRRRGDQAARIEGPVVADFALARVASNLGPSP